MTLKKFESGLTTVRLPIEIRLALREKNWTILQAIKNGLCYVHPSHYKEEACLRPECIRAKRRLAQMLIKKQMERE